MYVCRSKFDVINEEGEENFFMDLAQFSNMIIIRRNGIFMHNFSFLVQIIDFKLITQILLNLLYYLFFPPFPPFQD